MSLDVKNYDPARMYGAVDSLGATTYTGAVIHSSTTELTGNVTVATNKVTIAAASGNTLIAGTLGVTGIATFTAAAAFSAAPTGALPLRPITDSAGAGATVVLTAAQNGATFNNASSSGSPSWTLPTAANGLWYTFTCSNTTAGFTVTGGTIKAKASATGAAITGTTLTHTQATAVIGDHITLNCDGTVWRAVSQAGTFAAT